MVSVEYHVYCITLVFENGKGILYSSTKSFDTRMKMPIRQYINVALLPMNKEPCFESILQIIEIE